MGLPILLPEQLQGHPFTAQLPMDPRPIRLGPLHLRGQQRRKQGRLQDELAEALGERPANASEVGEARTTRAILRLERPLA